MSARRVIRLLAVFVRTCLVKEMEFRGNFWMGVFANVIWVSAYLVFMKIIYANTKSVGGWTQGQGVVLLGTYVLTRSIVDIAFSRNLAELPNLVRMGTFDFVLVKPVNSQFFVSLRYMNFGEIGSALAAIAMIVYGARMDHIRITGSSLLAYVCMLACAICIFYGIYLMLMATAFWFVRVDNLWTLGETVFQVARVPINIFGVRATQILTFVVPLIFIAHVPAQALMSLLTPLLFVVGVAMSITLLVLSSLFWSFATRFYTSASS
ncbi:MAG TPA: ABC-2 family transporter protein [Armatimonadota bacterium]